MRKHTPEHSLHKTFALEVADGLREETVYKEGRQELCCGHLADGMAELAR
jgi:hypothetical protein